LQPPTHPAGESKYIQEGIQSGTYARKYFVSKQLLAGQAGAPFARGTICQMWCLEGFYFFTANSRIPHSMTIIRNCKIAAIVDKKGKANSHNPQRKKCPSFEGR